VEPALACAWDTGRAAVLQQPVTNLNLVTRGTLRLGEHQLTAELTASRTESAKRFSNVQVSSNTTNAPLRFPRDPASPGAYDAVFNRLLAAFPGQISESQRGQSLAYRWRCIECGPREIETEVDTQRLFVGAEGPMFGGWDYRVGGVAAALSTLGGGYFRTSTAARLMDATASCRRSAAA
jgi:iron complex outermembrane receptor protein